MSMEAGIRPAAAVTDAPGRPAARPSVRDRLERVTGGVTRRELLLLAGAMALSLAIHLTYVVITRGHVLMGDEPHYDKIARLAADGHWLWSETPYGIPHPSAWKTPLYPIWIGIGYTILGPHPDRLMAVQSLFGPLIVALTWLLARRLVGPRGALVAAFVVAIYPNAWQYDVRMFPDGPGTILTLAVMLSFLGLRGPPTVRRAALTGALLGVTMLMRPSSAFLIAGIAVAWWIAAGARAGTARIAVTVLAAALVISPWTIRNAVVLGAFIPLSVQDAAISGTFNDESAGDPVFPYAWRPVPKRDVDVFATPREERELYRELRSRAFSYIREHPESVPKAFFWNGLSRLWDIRRPSQTLHEVPFEGRTRSVALTGLLMYWPLLALAVAGLWRNRRRRAVVLPVLALALAASVGFTTASGTRYRATLEPLIVVLAVASVTGLRQPEALTAGRRARR